MSKEWSETEPRKRVTDHFEVSEDSHGVTYAARDAVKRVAGDARVRVQQLERGAQRQIRRYPLSSVLLAVAVGMALGGLMVAVTDRASARRRSWFGYWH